MTAYRKDLIMDNNYKLRRSTPYMHEEDEIDDLAMSPNGNFSGHDRKRRRGIIEKRRRDRINSCLMELKTLVPDASQKQNSAKLEKAEILQMTVAFLKHLHQENYIVTHETKAADQRFEGFQDCINEVVRFMDTYDSNYQMDEFRAALFNHMQEFSQKLQFEVRSRIAQMAAMSTMLQNTTTNPMVEAQQMGQQMNQNLNGVNNPLSLYDLNTQRISASQNKEFEQHYPYDQDIKYSATGHCSRLNQTSSPNSSSANKSHEIKKAETVNNSSSVPCNAHTSSSSSTNTFNTTPPLLGSNCPNESQSTTSPSVPSNLEDTELLLSNTSQNNLSPINAISVPTTTSTNTLQAFMNRMCASQPTTSQNRGPSFNTSSPGKVENTSSWYSSDYTQRSNHASGSSSFEQNTATPGGEDQLRTNTNVWERYMCHDEAMYSQGNPNTAPYNASNNFYFGYENSLNLYNEY